MIWLQNSKKTLKMSNPQFVTCCQISKVTNYPVNTPIESYDCKI